MIRLENEIKEPHNVVWDKCLDIIKESVIEKQYKTWFEPIKPIKLKDEVLTIQVPNKFFYEWLEEHHLAVLKKAILNVLGSQGRLEYLIMVENHQKISGKHTPTNQFTKNVYKNPYAAPGIKKVKIHHNLNKKYTFESYIEGDCNRLARSAGKAVADRPGGTAFNPLFIYGGVGLGKTHLAHAIGNDIIASNASANVLYMNTDQFTTQIIQAIKNNTISDLINHFQLIDVLIVDDIQFLAKREKTQEIFFNIFNGMHQSGKQIILTSDRPPKDLEGMQNRLISRFKWGLSADLQTPEFETRIAILHNKFGKEIEAIPDNVLEFVCFNIKNNIRELEGVIISLIAQSTLNHKEIDVDLAKEVIKKYVNQSNKEITLDNIKKLVAEHFEVPVEKLQGKTRKRNIVMARQLSMYLAKQYTSKSLKNIGENFGGRDHSTVIYSVQAIQNLMDTDLIFKDQVEEIERKVSMSLV